MDELSLLKENPGYQSFSSLWLAAHCVPASRTLSQPRHFPQPALQRGSYCSTSSLIPTQYFAFVLTHRALLRGGNWHKSKIIVSLQSDSWQCDSLASLRPQMLAHILIQFPCSLGSIESVCLSVLSFSSFPNSQPNYWHILTTVTEFHIVKISSFTMSNLHWLDIIVEHGGSSMMIHPSGIFQKLNCNWMENIVLLVHQMMMPKNYNGVSQ